MAIDSAPRSPDQLIARLEELQAAFDSVSDPLTRGLAEDLIGAIMELYGEGLERMLGIADGETRDALVADGVIASLLLIHDLYPVPLADRVQEALDTVRPYMDSHGGGVELLAVDEDGTAHLRLEGSCSGCKASQSTLELAIEQALAEHAPDLGGLEVEGVVEPEFKLPIVELPMAPEGAAGWHDLPPAMATLPAGTVAAVEVAGVALLAANVGGTLLVYRDRCASCGSQLHDGALKGGVLSCPAGCGHRYYLPGAGRSVDGDRLQLDPVPLRGGADGSPPRVALVSTGAARSGGERSETK